MDMLRFHKFTAGRVWVDDYGSSDERRRVQGALRLLAVPQPQAGHEVPADAGHHRRHDDRVVPAHSFKFAAALQAAQAGDAPVLIRIETRAGHGAGKPTAKMIEEVADQLAFLVKNLGMKLPKTF